MIDSHHGWNASLKPSFLAFVFSLILIFAAHRIVGEHHLSDGILMLTIFIIALMQAILQLVFFMHLGAESKPHWNSITFLFTVIVIILVIGGSVWIMNNLNYNLMMDMGKS
jgi:cytochrome o ubiquinol oxidase operon protein cyoD